MLDIFSLAVGVLIGFTPKFFSDRKAGMEAQYAVNRKNIQPNEALKGKAEYADIFRSISKEEVAWLQTRPPIFAVLNWMTFLGCYAGLYGIWIMGLLAVVCHVRWWLAMHNTLHLRARLPEYYSLCTPILGFCPVGLSFKDMVQTHMMEHHRQSKLLLEPNEEDTDAVWSLMPFLNMCIGLLIAPSNAGWFDNMESWVKGQQGKIFWADRAMSTSWLWLQLAVLHYGMEMLLPVLIAQHIGSFATFFLFHGVLHRKSFFKWLNDVDPSGGRCIPFAEPVLRFVVGPGGWMEIKWHDIHHAFSLDVGCIETQVTRWGCTPGTRVVPWEEVDRKMAEMCDEGLYIDTETGEPVSSLDLVGHTLGTRKRFLEAQGKTK